jgi:hypothetical protein
MAVDCSCAPDDWGKYYPKHVELKIFKKEIKHIVHPIGIE